MSLIEDIVYTSYKYNRDRSPDIKPEEWAAIFLNVAAMEKRYQEERCKAN